MLRNDEKEAGLPRLDFVKSRNDEKEAFCVSIQCHDSAIVESRNDGNEAVFIIL